MTAVCSAGKLVAAVPIPSVNLDAAAQACEAGDLDAFAAAGPLGFVLTPDSRTELLRALRDTNFHCSYSYGASAFTLAQALGLMAEAATGELGIAIVEQQRRLRLGKETAIAFRHDGRVYFGVRYASNLPLTPGHLWLELKPWYKQLERNRKRLEAWATTAVGVVAVELSGTPQQAEKGGDELLAAIVAEPDNVEHRLIYADWLIAQGDAQGELIQLCERRRALGVADGELDERINQLQRSYGERIAGEVAQLCSSHRLVHGFVTHIEMSAPSFAKHGPRLLATSPIEELELKPVNAKALARLARAPALSQLRGLRIGQLIGHQRPMPLDALCRSPHFGALERLEIWTWTSEGDVADGFAELAAPRLRSLRLYEVDSAAEVVAGLARNDVVRLQTLVINLRTHTAWPAGLAAPAFASLRKLEIDSNGAGVGRLFDGASLPELIDLEVGRDVPLSSLRLPSLRRLRLGGGRIEPRALTELLDALPNLEVLSIWDIDRAPADIYELLLARPDGGRLVGVDLHAREIDPELSRRISARYPLGFYEWEP